MSLWRPLTFLLATIWATPACTDDAAPGQDQRPGISEADLTAEVADAGSSFGLSVDLEHDILASSTRQPSPGVEHTEIQVVIGDGGGELLVSVNAGDVLAARQGQAGRRELISSTGTQSVYVGTDDAEARAVELFDGSRIIYVRLSGVDVPCDPGRWRPARPGGAGGWSKVLPWSAQCSFTPTPLPDNCDLASNEDLSAAARDPNWPGPPARKRRRKPSP